MRFEKYSISDAIKANLLDMGFFRTTDIQYKTIPAIMDGEDVLAIAQTGTGKTAAFAIPIVDEVHSFKEEYDSRGIYSLVMVPTRELAQQIGKVFSQLSRNTLANSYAIYGGVEQDQQISQLKGGIDILIATPGRMFDLINQKHIDVNYVRILVLDEADHMLDLGFIKDIEKIKKKLRSHQTLFFSATINTKIKRLAYDQVKSNALRIQVSPEKLVSKNVTHYVSKVAMDNKRHLLVNFINDTEESKILVFVRTQVRAERVLKHLAKNDILAVGLHGGMEQADREANLEHFRGQKEGVLVATDVSARGIDLPGITHVINYDLPDDPENYVHRIGRTGRGFEKGDAIAFFSPEEKEKLDTIQEFIQTKITELKFDKNFTKEIVTPDIENMEITDMIALEESLHKKPKKNKKGKQKVSPPKRTKAKTKNKK